MENYLLTRLDNQDDEMISKVLVEPEEDTAHESDLSAQEESTL